MIDRKRIREITGYTYEQQKGDAAAWYSGALLFFEAAQVLHESRDQIASGLKVFAFTAGMSLEIVFKSILARKKTPIREIHILRDLADAAGVRLNQDQKETLDLLTEFIVWAGRYPVPKNAQQWDWYHDEVLEKHIARTSKGNVYSVRLNPKNDPSWTNYLKIWKICVAEFENSESTDSRNSGQSP